MADVGCHFVELRWKIWAKLSDEKRAEHAKYPWLYGALGDPRADVMFVCENPSRDGVDLAHNCFAADFGIEAQWRGRRPNRLRRVLCKTGRKCGEPGQPGGWRCYITNVIKEIWTVGDFNKKLRAQKFEMACEWADVLQWELCRVQPKIVFCVGRKAEWAVKRLVKDGCIDFGSACSWQISIEAARHWYVPHYSYRRSDEFVECKMRNAIIAGLNAVPVDRCEPAD